MEQNNLTIRSKPAKILLIEDDMIAGEMYTDSLVSDGYQVTWVKTGSEGLDAALKKDFDIILLDILLPSKTGDFVLHELRAGENKVPNSKVIVFTNLAQGDESRAEMEKYADDYLIKADVVPSQLISIIKRLLANET